MRGTILTADENSFVYNFAKKETPNGENIWIGTKRNTSGKLIILVFDIYLFNSCSTRILSFFSH